MDQAMRAYCGTDCESCEWRERTNCGGCKACGGDMFWGTCEAAKCAIEQGHTHCGGCDQLPCTKLKALYDDPEHGDNGERLQNLKDWMKE